MVKHTETPEEGTPTAEAKVSLDTTIAVKNEHLPFLRAAFEHAGWSFEATEEAGITTDDGYDAEVIVKVKVDAPLAVLADASPQRYDSQATDLVRLVSSEPHVVPEWQRA